MTKHRQKRRCFFFVLYFYPDTLKMLIWAYMRATEQEKEVLNNCIVAKNLEKIKCTTGLLTYEKPGCIIGSLPLSKQNNHFRRF